MKIITDSAADLTPEDIEAYGIAVAPLYIQFPEGEVKAGDLTPDQFYDRLEAMQPDTPTTAQPSAGEFKSLYERLLEKGSEVLSIHVSSGLSGTVNAAKNGADQLAGKVIEVVDSLTLSGGQRFQVLAAARAARSGWNIEAIRAKLDEIRRQTEVVYTLETLDYLARGGRIGRVQALASSLLNIKPLIHVDRSDGKYSTVGKSRTIRKAVDDLTRHIQTLYDQSQPLWVSVMHGKFAEQAERLADSLQSAFNIARLEILRISPVLGVHTGPGIVGATVLPMELFEGID